MNINVKTNASGVKCVQLNDRRIDIARFSIKKSWKNEDIIWNDFNFNLDINSYNLIINDLDIVNHTEIILDEAILDIKNYYTITFEDRSSNIYNVHIDFSTYHNLTFSKENIFFHNFRNFTLENKEDNQNYQFIIKNEINIEFPIEVVFLNNTFVYFRILGKSEISGNNFNLYILKDSEVVYNGKVAIFINNNVKFNIEKYDMNNTIRCTFKPSFNYSNLKKVEIFNSKNIKIAERMFDYDDSRSLTFFIPNPGIKNKEKLKFDFTYNEDVLNKENITYKFSNFYYIGTYGDVTEVEFNNYKTHYNFLNDTYEIFWDCPFYKNNRFKILLNNKVIGTTKNNKFTITKFKNKQNGSQKMSIKVILEQESSLNIASTFNFTIEVENYHNTYKSIDYKPYIDYSDCLDVSNDVGILSWKPSVAPAIYEYSIKMENQHSFLDEYCNIWSTFKILNQDSQKFDLQYTDYDLPILYDFDNKGTYYRTPNNSKITYIEDGLVINNRNLNSIKFPIWFTEPNKLIEVSVKARDYWGNIIGTDNVTFDVNYNDDFDFFMKDLIIKRGQPKFMFGESGTVGSFYNLSNATPLDVKLHYSSENRTYTGTRLIDSTNIDNNGESLGTYFSGDITNVDFLDFIEIIFKRSSNFYKFEYCLENSMSDVIIDWTSVPILGNTNSVNKFTIPRDKFQTTGDYKMKIKTTNSSGEISPIKEIMFHTTSNRPDKAVVNIKPEDHYVDTNGNIIINKKYFQMEILNNSASEDYAGWKFKESHFYFKVDRTAYKEYPDYVVQADITNGSLILNNTQSIENGNYTCKVINYDYAGNASEPTEFTFKLSAEFKITPEKLYTNDVNGLFKWTIKKPQDVQGFFWYYRYSFDGVNWAVSDTTKVESYYYINDKNTSREHTLETYFKMPTQTGSNAFGIYELVCYEYNPAHPNGDSDEVYKSSQVQVLNISDPTTPVYCSNTIGDIAYISNRGKYNEWVYTKDINALKFQKVHNDDVFDDPEIEGIQGTYYKIQMIEPHINGQIIVPYEAVLPLPSQSGIYVFDEILTKCGIVNPIEGVWELRVITIDKFGNSNALNGYYTYYINYVSREPNIYSLSPISNNSMSYFGSNAGVIGYYITTSNIYQDILNYEQHKEKFIIEDFEIQHISNPQNNVYSSNIKLINDSYIEILSPLSDTDKQNHSRDGEYQIGITALDVLKRKSTINYKQFTIDTILDSSLTFLGNNTHYILNPTITAAVVGKVKSVKYSQDASKPLDQWLSTTPTPITYQTETFLGVSFNGLSYTNTGFKTLYYIIEEMSGNTTDILSFVFKIEAENSLLPIFDYNNKIFYTLLDDVIKVSWNATNKDVSTFKIKIQQCHYTEDGTLALGKTFIPSIDNSSILVEAGPLETGFIDVGTLKEYSVDISSNSTVFTTGTFQITVEGTSLYNTIETNTFIFQNDMNPILIDPMIINSPTITVNNNIIQWSQINEAMHYEVSYDGTEWIKTFYNKFYINSDLLITDNAGLTFIYLRWKNKSGFYSTETKTLVNFNKIPMIDVVITPANNNYITTEDIFTWSIKIENSQVANFLYYSFDKVKWHSKVITGSVMSITNNIVNPIPGVYDIYAYTTDRLLTEGENLNNVYKTNIIHSYIEKKVDEITGNLIDIEYGKLFLTSKRLYLENKEPDVDYYIYVNGRLVPEGYEINSSTLSNFFIGLYGKRKGINKTYTIYDKNTFYIRLENQEKYKIIVGRCELECVVDGNQLIMYHTITSKQQVIMFREKGTTDDYLILYDGQPLSISKQWEFMATDFVF